MKITEEQIDEYAEEYVKSLGVLSSVSSDGLNNIKSDFKEGVKKAISILQPEWISVKDVLPEFGVHVLVRCRIWGTFISEYEKIDPEYEWGNWRRGDELGILPPLFWMPLPEPPKTD